MLMSSAMKVDTMILMERQEEYISLKLVQKKVVFQHAPLTLLEQWLKDI